MLCTFYVCTICLDVCMYLCIPFWRIWGKEKGMGLRSQAERNLASHLERELRKLECTVSYNSSPCSFRGKGRNNGGSIVVLWGSCFVSYEVSCGGWGAVLVLLSRVVGFLLFLSPLAWLAYPCILCVYSDALFCKRF